MREIFRSSTTWKLALIGLVLVGLVLAAREFPLLQWAESFAAWARNFGIIGALIYGVFFGIISILMVPCLPFTIMAGFTFGWFNGVVAVMLGIAIGASFGFLFARYAARGAVSEKIASYPRFNAIDNAIAKDGWKIVGLLRMCPVPFGITNYLYGLTAIDFWRYMAATMIGMLPATVCFVYLGAFGKQTLDGPRHPVQYVLGALTLAAMIGVVVILSRIARRSAGINFDASDEDATGESLDAAEPPHEALSSPRA
jgi:uncharacterized membrane protein YdjX (TVP38/TMEM64 family)